MSMGWSLWGSDDPNQIGLNILQTYFDEASKYPGFGFSDFDAWITHLNSIDSGYPAFLGQLVLDNYASTTVDQAKDRVYQLANQSAGQASTSQIIAAAGGKGDTVNWAAGIPEVYSETAHDVSQIAQNVGSGVIGTLNATKYLPWILGGAAVLFIVVYASGAGKSTGTLLGALKKK